MAEHKDRQTDVHAFIHTHQKKVNKVVANKNIGKFLFTKTRGPRKKI